MTLVQLWIETSLFFWVYIPKAQASWTGTHEDVIDRKLLYSQILRLYEKRMDFTK